MATDPLNNSERQGARPSDVPTDDDLFWPAAMREVHTGVMHASQAAAVGILGWSLVGWAVITSGLILGAIGQTAPVAVGLTMWVLPLVWWSLAAVWSLRVFSFRRYRYFANSPDSTRKAIERIGRKKTEHLYWATGLWGAGMLALICALFYEAARRG